MTGLRLKQPIAQPTKTPRCFMSCSGLRSGEQFVVTTDHKPKKPRPTSIRLSGLNTLVPANMLNLDMAFLSHPAEAPATLSRLASAKTSQAESASWSQEDTQTTRQRCQGYSCYSQQLCRPIALGQYCGVITAKTAASLTLRSASKSEFRKAKEMLAKSGGKKKDAKRCK